jgi:cyclopropane-fatty-acyl-phospholipid synthase
MCLQTYGKDQAVKWMVYWRLFYMACSELFGYHGGEEWGVGHYLFAKPAPVSNNGKLQVQ